MSVSVKLSLYRRLMPVMTAVFGSPVAASFSARPKRRSLKTSVSKVVLAS
jgi:hypothetical protein